MPKLTVSNSGKTLMKTLLDKGQPVASSCGGDGVCGKCRIEIHKGAENLSSATELEIELQKRHQLSKNERISCQCLVLGEVEVSAAYW